MQEILKVKAERRAEAERIERLYFISQLSDFVKAGHKLSDAIQKTLFQYLDENNQPIQDAQTLDLQQKKEEEEQRKQKPTLDRKNYKTNQAYFRAIQEFEKKRFREIDKKYNKRKRQSEKKLKSIQKRRKRIGKEMDQRLAKQGTQDHEVRYQLPPNYTPKTKDVSLTRVKRTEKITKKLFFEKKEEIREEIPIPLSLVQVIPGNFYMGASNIDLLASENEKPRHLVELTKGLWVSPYQCTREVYEKVMGVETTDTSPSNNKQCPIYKGIDWCDAIVFCNRLSSLEGLNPAYDLPYALPIDEEKRKVWSQKVKWNRDANGYRLPTEAEWEYCARAGQDTRFSGSDDLDLVGWYSENNLEEEPQPVGKKAPNLFGLYDMSGNRNEWCWDTKSKNLYSSRESCIDPVHEKQESTKYPARVARGAWDYFGGCRVTHRSMTQVTYKNGFRFVRT
ncbi:MAG: SUMF1/EgtB/PvdO family nonheme iron enzyme, partial [Myxococcota bacterium]|nr:SUMF1/EgtB/PvdO family nonheme iron enzyme [Myxococcota bacterium]